MAGRQFYEFGPFRLDPARRLLSRQGEVIPLTSKVLDTLLVLVENRGRVVDKEELMKAVWPDTFVEEGNLTQNISMLRKVLGESPTQHAYIETLPKRGYRFVASVTEAAAGPWLNRRKAVLGAAALLVVLGIAGGTLLFHTGRTKSPVSSLTAVPLTSDPGFELHPSFSPDGNQVAFAWDGEKRDNFDIYVKLIGAEHPLRLTTNPARDFCPAWSPDGRSIAFLRDLGGGKAAVLVIPAIGGPERRLADNHPWAPGWAPVIEGSLEWSPDGKWLATTDKSSLAEPMGVFLISLETGEKRRLTSPPRLSQGYGDGNAAFSPDGRTLAFSRVSVEERSELCLLALSGDLTAKGGGRCRSLSGQNPYGLVWTPDGREVIFSSGDWLGRPSLWRVSAFEPQLSSLQRLPSLGEGAQHPAVSRVAGRLAYDSLVYDLDIWRLELPDPTQTARKAAQPAELISSTRHEWNAQYSPDGKRIVFLSNRSGRPAVWVCASDGSDPVQLTSFPAPVTGCPRWSPDGQQIVFDSNLEGQYEVYVINADGGRPRRLTHNPADDAVASWSRDGRWIYFSSNRTGEWQVWKMPPDEGGAIQVTRHGGFGPFESFDGKSVCYCRARGLTSLWGMPVGGGEETKIVDSATETFTVVDQGIYFVPPRNPQGSSSIQFLSFATGRITPIAAVHGPTRSGLSVSPDGRFLLYVSGEVQGSDLMLVENFR